MVRKEIKGETKMFLYIPKIEEFVNVTNYSNEKLKKTLYYYKNVGVTVITLCEVE